MTGDFGQVYVMDWGIARHLESANKPEGPSESSQEGFIGTPSYMAPEQLGRGIGMDHRTDVFLLGGLLYAIITGCPPYQGGNVWEVTDKAYRCDFPPPSAIAGERVPLELEKIVMRAMAEDPADRYPTVERLQQDVDRFLRGNWHLPMRTYSPGSDIVSEDEQGDEAFIIVEGRCRVLTGSGDDVVVLRELRAGDVFGETAVISEKPRTATIRALDEVTVMVVTSDLLSSALGLNSWIGPFVKALAERFREVDARLRALESNR